MRLKDAQVDFIAADLREKGIAYDPLHEDLTDHICSEVEGLMAEGQNFMDAYLTVVAKFEKRGFESLDRETTTMLSAANILRSFFTTGLRLFRRNLGYSLIRVLGLALGIAVFFLALIYSNYQRSFDRFHADADEIYRLGRNIDRGPVAVTAFPLVPALRADYVDYEFTRFFKDRSNTLFRLGNEAFFEEKMIWADAWFLRFFDFEGFRGNADTALSEPFTVVLTSEMGRKYFGREPELGELIDFRWNGKFYPLKITGIIPKWPENMHIQFEALVSFKTSETVFPGDISNGWNMNYCYSYVKLPEQANPGQFESTFAGFVNKYVSDQDHDTETYLGFLQPLKSIHTEPEILANYTETINPDYPKMGVAIGLLVLLITSVNFITLTVAQFHSRTREMGIRKAVGANRRQVIFQLVFETFLLILGSFLIGLGLVYANIGFVNDFMQTRLVFSMLYLPEMLIFIPLFILVMTLVTGLYPAVVFSEQNIMDTISAKKRRVNLSFRKGLLTSQFLMAAVLISFASVIYSQLDFMSNQATGYDRDQIIYTPHGRSIRYEPEVFKTMAMSNPNIEKVSLSFYKPTDIMGNKISVQSKNAEPLEIAATSIDEDFFETFNIEMISGTNFSKEGMDMEKAFILNESAVALLGLENPLDEVLKTEFSTGNPNMPIEQREGRIIGVVKDVHFESLHHPIKPTIFLVKPYWYFFINIKVNALNMDESLAHLEQTWNQLFPDEPFEYDFLDREFARQYESENRTARALIAMALLAVLTACFGLFSYMKFVAQQKVKEVSVRKVLGANLSHLTRIFSREFVTAVLLANVFSWPVSYYLSSKWLQSFAYRIDFSLEPFYLTLGLLLMLAMLTVLQELIKMIRLNPSKTLRYD